MKSRLTPELAILFTKISVFLTCSWPPALNAERSRRFAFDVLWYILFISALLLLFPLLWGICEHVDDPVIMAKSICFSCAVTQTSIKMVLCRMQRRRFEILYSEMENICKKIDSYERHVVQRYIDSFKYVQLPFTIWCYMAAVAVICGPLFLPQTFPTDAKYPFSVDRHPIKEVIYVHQGLVGLQVSAGMTVDCQIALLLWYVAAKFEVVATKLSRIENEDQFDQCIEEHREALRYANEAKLAVRFLVLTTVTTTSIGVIFGSINIVDVGISSISALTLLVPDNDISLFEKVSRNAKDDISRTRCDCVDCLDAAKMQLSFESL